MEKTIYRVVALCGILLRICSSATEAITTEQNCTVPAIFVFGDSLVDAGTNNFIAGSDTLANYLPYGETFFHYPTGRFTNGRHLVDFLASHLGLPFMPPFLKPGASFLQGVNFGSAGSGILSTTGGNNGVTLSMQVQQFQQVATQLSSDLGSGSASDLISKSLFIFVTGSNDLSAYLYNATLQQTVTPAEYVTSLVSDLQTYIQNVYGLGARKIAIFGTGPLGCSPTAMAAFNGTNGECLQAPNTLAQGYNTALVELSRGLNSNLPDVHTVVGNLFETVLNFVINGTNEGFTERSNACCGLGPFNGAKRCGPLNSTNLCEDVGKFVFWDTQHPTERVYSKIAELLWDGGSSIIRPMNIRSLAEL